MATTQEVIKELKKHLKEKRLSVIIGAGFSKNASNKYLSWRELLRDMIIEMYGNTKTKLGTPQIDQLVEKVISEKGYLSVASDYVRRRGYHEAIDEYVESRTPIIKRDGNDYSVILDGKKQHKPVDLNIHKLLLSFEWNNVYTFNYDNLLDIAADTDKNDDINKEIIKCQEDIIKLTKEKLKKEEGIAKLNNKRPDVQNITASILASDTLPGNNRIKNSSSENEYFANKKLVKDKDEVDKLQKEVDEFKTEIKRNETRIEGLRREQKDLYMIVDSAFKISLRKTKNIYKLHGNIRSDSTSKYGFDCDPRCHYIISQEDYDSYREKHEAFVSLMRIALLQDYFCLIGFSGDDPNFFSWISWVKDILDQRVLNENSSNNNNDAKIFFIDVSGVPLDKGKELFFKNHYIKHVPLFDTKTTDGTIIKQGVSKFLNSLKIDKEKAIEAIKEYTSFWETNVLSKETDNDNYLFGYKRSTIRSVWESLHYNRLPKLKTYVCQKRRIVIGNMGTHMKKHAVDEDTARLFTMALKGELLPIDEVMSDASIEKFMDNINDYGDVATAVQDSRMRYATLTGKYDLDDIKNLTLDESIYESILRRFFNLDFAGAVELIEKWNVEEFRWKVIKLSLKKIMGKVKADDKELTIDSDLLEYNNQELLYSLQTLKRLIAFQNNRQEKLKEINRAIDEIKESTLQESVFNNLEDNIEYLTNKLNEQKTKISSYGDNRISFNLGATDLPLIYSIQLIQYFIETGLPLYASSVIYYSKDNWYLAFKNIYRRYPAACLFYSLQFGNEKYYIQRIAQDYVYSNSLRTFCEEALLKMLRAYRMPETPVNIKNSILLAAPLFLSYVPNNIWQADFEVIYDESDLADRNENKDTANPLYDFLIAGIEYSKRRPFHRKVLYKTMKRSEKIDDIDNRMIIAAQMNVKIGKQSKELNKSIDDLILESNRTPNYYVLFNLQAILTPAQRNHFLEKLLKYDFAGCLDPNMIMASLDYGKDTPLVKKIEKAIIENPMLWRNGIGKGKTGKYTTIAHTYHLPLFDIQKFTSFDPQTIEKLYVKMKYSLNIIIQYLAETKRESFAEILNPGDVILEMFVFLGNNRSILNRLPDFGEISGKVEWVHEKLSGFNSIIDALASTEAQKVNKGISRLSYEVQYLGFTHFITEYLVIANIILKKSNAGLSNSIFHFSDVIKSRFKEVDKMLFEPIIRKILDVYQPYFSDIESQWDLDVRKEMVENAMINLNNALKEWGASRPFWNNYQRLFNYNQ